MVLRPQKTKFQLNIVENIQTLSIWANKLDISLFSNGMGSDPASVAYTAVEKSIKEKADVLLSLIHI